MAEFNSRLGNTASAVRIFMD